MATVTMDMNNCAVDSDSLATEEYGDEVLNAGWNPALPQQVVITEDHMMLPRSLACTNVEAFLKRMYANQR